ncbi:MAG: hypothetical protein QNK26_11885 [Moritella sp.]|uniref:type IV pilus modification PilV family protein n=1 Tax=Moritella sp. TaxID=78556 RepID=UPI0029B57CA2|nr:hypothetical protein [Moritella sp.]MDX2321279.1 hypothetical protein [Moritella sp.]
MSVRKYSWQQGGGLIEVIVCAFMLSLALFNITALKLTQAHIVLQQSQYTAAWALAGHKLNELRYLTDSADEFEQLSSNQGSGMNAGDNHYDQYWFNLSWQVSVISNSTLSSALKQVVIKVRWIDKGNKPHEISGMTIFNKDIIVR